MATHSNVLAWKMSWMEEPGGLYSSWGHKESDITEQLDNDNLIAVGATLGKRQWFETSNKMERTWRRVFPVGSQTIDAFELWY